MTTNHRPGAIAVVAASLLLGGCANNAYLDAKRNTAAETVAQAIRNVGDLRVDSWISTNAQFFSAMSAQILAALTASKSIGAKHIESSR